MNNTWRNLQRLLQHYPQKVALEKIKIFDDTTLELDKMDVHNLDKKLKLEPDPILNDIEVLG